MAFSCCSLADGKCSLSKCSLVLCNFIFALTGAVLLGTSLFVRFSSDWSALFDTPQGGFSMLYFMMGLGATVLAISLLGMHAALKESKSLLCGYLTIVTLSLGAQLFVATILFRFDETVSQVAENKTGITLGDLRGFQRQIARRIGDSTSAMYTNGQCTTLTNTDTDLTIACAHDNSHWFETFVNGRCVPDSGSWNAGLVQACESQNQGRNTEAAVLVWCKCKEAVGSELKKYSKPLFMTAIGMAGVEFVLLLSAVYMVCCYNKRKAEEERISREQDRGYQQDQETADVTQPRVGGNINMV